MSDDKTPIEQAVDQALDAFVYAPIGLVFDGPALFPKLVEKGRNQVQVARMMGQMAVQMGQTEAEKRVAKTQGPLREALVAMGVVPPESKPAPAAEPTPEPAPARAKPAVKARQAPKARKSAKKAAARNKPSARKSAKKTTARKSAPSAAGASASALGIPDYDSLSASQVVKRLGGMAAGDLADVRAYEAATRARKTILNRITQLQKD